jgi:hypothetical protein
LDEFVAEFECVPRQIGAIILVDDQVVGVERAPSHAYWQSVWPCLIRECYGSLAIRVARLKGARAEAPTSRRPLPDGIGSLDEPLTLTRDESTGGLTVETVQPGRFTGQVIRDGQRNVYASLPATKKWLADNQWQTAKPFAI